MSNRSLHIAFEQLPDTLPIFPLSNAIVMPGCHLPLNIFEPRYIDMVLDSLGQHRLIGMIQPESGDSDNRALYRTGTAGRIVSFNELPGERLLIVLQGICRFDIQSEISTDASYRRVAVDWDRFRDDYEDASQHQTTFDRDRLMNLLKEYFERKGFNTNWSAIEDMPVSLLVDTLAGQLPLASPEKQALIEAVSPEERVSRFIHLLEFDVASGSTSESTIH